MGMYINETSTGRPLPADYMGKIDFLLKDGAAIVPESPYIENMICVIDNGPFAAAGYAYSQNEYNVFKVPDGRIKTWLQHPKAQELAR